MKFIEKNNISNKLINSLKESEAWSAEELDAASKAMKAQGHMSYEEFCKELKLAKQGKSKKIKIINNDNKEEIKEEDSNIIYRVFYNNRNRETFHYDCNTKEDAEKIVTKLNKIPIVKGGPIEPPKIVEFKDGKRTSI